MRYVTVINQSIIIEKTNTLFLRAHLRNLKGLMTAEWGQFPSEHYEGPVGKGGLINWVSQSEGCKLKFRGQLSTIRGKMKISLPKLLNLFVGGEYPGVLCS